MDDAPITSGALTTAKRVARGLRHYSRARAALRPGLRHPTVVVHQPGHVGSNSVVNTIRVAAGGPRVLHPHRLSQRRDEPARFDPRAASFEIDEIELVRALRRHPDLPLDVISIVRDPVARNLNMFLYQHIHLLGSPGHDDLIGVLVKLFRAEWLGRREPFERFFNNDFVPMWGVEIADFEFDPDTGAHRVDRLGRRYVVLRTDRLDKAHIALGRCLGITIPPIKHERRSDMLGYGAVREAFEQALALPDDYLNRMYGSPAVGHFFTSEEIEKLRQRWSHSA